MKRIAWWAGFVLAFALPSIAPAATFITLVSDPGDAIGASLAGAGPQPFDNTNGTIAIAPNARGGFSVQFTPSPGTENLFLDFGAPAGQQLATARYEIPLRYPVAPANRAALEVYRGNFRCDVIAGRFLVRELVFGVGGTLQRLAIDFDQYCNGSTAGLHGAVRFNSAVPYAPEVLPTSVTADTPGAPITISVAAPTPTCALLDTEFRDIGEPLPIAVVPYGTFAFTAVGCDPQISVATFTLDFVQPPTGNVVLWKFGPTPDEVSAHWYTIPFTLSGSQLTFQIADGGLGDDDLTVNGVIQSYGAITVGGVLQDMWWGGPSENGWGMSISQHGSTLFSLIYVYDAAGNPTWLAMPGGAWAGPYTSYTGPVYRPHGSPYYAYDSAFVGSGPAVGTATLTFTDLDHARLDYTIDGVSGTKQIMRQAYGANDTRPIGQFADMWWGGREQNGWGIAVEQQFATLFSVWFTYDANGAPVWFVMPGGTWTDDTLSTYTGALYKTTGSPWLGHTYDQSRLRANEVGAFTIHFDVPAGEFDYIAEGHKGTMAITRQPF